MRLGGTPRPVQAPAVIVLLHTQHYKLLQRNLLYTAITRGKRLVLVVGSSRAVHIAIMANQVRERRTSLRERLRDILLSGGHSTTGK